MLQLPVTLMDFFFYVLKKTFFQKCKKMLKNIILDFENLFWVESGKLDSKIDDK